MFLSAAILLCWEPCLLLFLSQKSLNSDNCSAVSADQLLNDKQNSVVEIQNHELNEQLMLINQLDEEEKKAMSALDDAKLLQQFKAVDNMDKEDKQVIKKLIDAFITKAKLKQLAL